MGETRRKDVIPFARSVSACTLDKRIAFLPGGFCVDLPNAAGDTSRNEARVAIRAAPELRMMVFDVRKLPSSSGESWIWLTWI